LRELEPAGYTGVASDLVDKVDAEPGGSRPVGCRRNASVAVGWADEPSEDDYE